MVIAYICLALCIIFNLLSCSLLTASDGLTRPVPSVLGILFALLNYFVLSRSILYLNISIAYAIWAGIGIIASTAISVFYFRQKLSKAGVFFACLIALGLIIIHLFGTM